MMYEIMNSRHAFYPVVVFPDDCCAMNDNTMFCAAALRNTARPSRFHRIPTERPLESAWYVQSGKEASRCTLVCAFLLCWPLNYSKQYTHFVTDCLPTSSPIQARSVFLNANAQFSLKCFWCVLQHPSFVGVL